MTLFQICNLAHEIWANRTSLPISNSDGDARERSNYSLESGQEHCKQTKSCVALLAYGRGNKQSIYAMETIHKFAVWPPEVTVTSGKSALRKKPQHRKIVLTLTSQAYRRRNLRKLEGSWWSILSVLKSVFSKTKSMHSESRCCRQNSSGWSARFYLSYCSG